MRLFSEEFGTGRVDKTPLSAFRVLLCTTSTRTAGPDSAQVNTLRHALGFVARSNGPCFSFTNPGFEPGAPNAARISVASERRWQ